jgi:hypothetical protein
MEETPGQAGRQGSARRTLGRWPSAALAIALLFGAYANLRIINKEVERLSGPGRTDEIVYEAHLAPLSKLLPRNAVVGYVTGAGQDAPHETKYFYLTQYCLCPSLVVRGADHAFVIGGYYGADRPAGVPAGLSLLRDFGDGLLLYRGAAK